MVLILIFQNFRQDQVTMQDYKMFGDDEVFQHATVGNFLGSSIEGRSLLISLKMLIFDNFRIRFRFHTLRVYSKEYSECNRHTAVRFWTLSECYVIVYRLLLNQIFVGKIKAFFRVLRFGLWNFKINEKWYAKAKIPKKDWWSIKKCYRCDVNAGCCERGCCPQDLYWYLSQISSLNCK